MSDLAAIAVFGRPHRNTGAPVGVALLGELYVGGSGVWVFRRMVGEPFSVSLCSTAAFADELLAGYALSGLDEESAAAAGALLGADWSKREVDVDASVVRRLAALVADVQMGVLVTEMGVSRPSYDEAAWAGTQWSVTFATAAENRTITQWG